MFVREAILNVPNTHRAHNMTPHEDPAERSNLRLFYRDWRPTRLGKLWNGAWPGCRALAQRRVSFSHCR